MSSDLLLPLANVGLTPNGYRRFSWTGADAQMRAWFRTEALARDLIIETDRNGNLWAYRGDPADQKLVVTGSHLDSVPDGGGFDGPLGVASAFAALDRIGEVDRTIAVVAFVEEEGARFGIACLGSRLSTGSVDPEEAGRLRDGEGVTLVEAMTLASEDPSRLGPDQERLDRVAAFVELHIEQGQGLKLIDRPLAVATEIWPHGRWRLDLIGEADHAGTTRMEDRNDPMPRLARSILAVEEEARSVGGRATIGKVAIQPNGVNAIPARVNAWLDARAATEEAVRAIVAAAGSAIEESFTPAVEFDRELRTEISGILDGAPTLPTAAGHDAGILQLAGIPSAMIFVRNRTGVSHSPKEHAEPEDIESGVNALATVLQALAQP